MYQNETHVQLNRVIQYVSHVRLDQKCDIVPHVDRGLLEEQLWWRKLQLKFILH